MSVGLPLSLLLLVDLRFCHRVPPHAQECKSTRQRDTADLARDRLVLNDPAEHRVLAQPVEAEEGLLEAATWNTLRSRAVVVKRLGEDPLLARTVVELRL